MSFADLPEMPPLLSRGAEDFAAWALAASQKVQQAHRTCLDVPYGEDYFQKVDFYLPRGDGEHDLPILCFLHGGGWRNGFKEWMGFMAPAIISLPAIFASVSYRLAPHTKLPDMLNDCVDAVALVRRLAPDMGGDQARIVIGGNSAGGHLAALVVLRRDLIHARGLPENAIKACCPVSGIYDFADARATPGSIVERVIAETLDDPADAAAFSPLRLVDGNTTPFYVTWGTEDVEEVIPSSEEFKAALEGQTGLLEHHVWPMFNHWDTARSLKFEDNAWVQKVRQWLREPPF